MLIVIRCAPSSSGFGHARPAIIPQTMRRVEQQQRADLVGDGAQFANRMRKQIEAAPDGDQPGPQRMRLIAQGGEIDRVAVGRHGGGMDLEPVATGASRHMVRGVPPDGGRRHDDPVARFGRHHEGVEIGDGAGRHPDFGVARGEGFGGELRRDDLDPLDALQPHLVFVARIAERGARAEAGGEGCFRLRVHHVRARIEVDAVGIMNGAVERDRAIDRIGDFAAGLAAGLAGNRLDELLAAGRDPGAVGESGHRREPLCFHARKGHASIRAANE